MFSTGMLGAGYQTGAVIVQHRYVSCRLSDCSANVQHRYFRCRLSDCCGNCAKPVC